jgi:hypothetical protein
MLTIRDTQMTAPLRRWLSESHDDGQLPLVVEQIGVDVAIRRADGSALSDAEEIEIRALLAAHAVLPLTGPPSRPASRTRDEESN